MNRLFAIIRHSENKSKEDSHRDCWTKIQRKFPRQYSSGGFTKGRQIEVWGDFQMGRSAQGHELYFTGELYDCGNSDANKNNTAEGILKNILDHGWESISMLNGRYTIICYDPIQDSIVIRNDQMGIQQLYFHKHPDFLLIGTELKFLLNHPLCPCQIDWHNSLKRPIPFIVLDGERNYNAWFKEISLMKEGHQLQYSPDKGNLTSVKYWDPFAVDLNENWTSAEQVMDDYMNLLEDAVKIRTVGSDTAQSFLSGGLDSSIICAMAGKQTSLETYSIVSQTTLLEGTTDMCEQLAQDLGFSNRQYLIPYNNIIFNIPLWKKRIWRAESPYAHTDSLTKTMLHYAISKYHNNVPYVLTGTGSDQLNGGLTRWIVEDPDEETEQWPVLQQAILREQLKNIIPEKYPVLWNCRSFFNKEFINSIGDQKLEPVLFHYYIKSNLYINRFTLHWDENKAASYHGRSVRYPFLDHRFMPFMASIPEKFHPELFYDKRILRHPGKKWLPPYILDKPKAPALTGPYDKRKPLYTYLLERDQYSLIYEALEQNKDIFDIEACITEFDTIKNQQHNIRYENLMHLVNLGLLEQLALKDESDMDMESELDPFIEDMNPWNESKSIYCRSKLKILNEPDLLSMKISFSPNCFLVHQQQENIYYIAKDDVLVYAIVSEKDEWIRFLNAINGGLSSSDILQNNQIEFNNIREYFTLCIREKIFELNSTTL